MGQFIRKNPALVTLPSCCELSLDDLLSHIDFQLGTDFLTESQDSHSVAFAQGVEEAEILAQEAKEFTATAEHDYDALDRIRTAEATGYVPQ